jgi:hypothetical protein
MVEIDYGPIITALWYSLAAGLFTSALVIYLTRRKNG